MRNLFWYVPGGFCLLAALYPAVFHGIFRSGVLLLAMAAALLIFMGAYRHRLPHRLRYGIYGAGSLCLAAALCLSAVMVQYGWRNRPPDGQAEVVLVLGARVLGSEPSLVLRYRLTTALGLLEANPAAVCVVSGGQGADEAMPEAEVMATWLEARGVAPERILIENGSTSTGENLLYSRDLLIRFGFDPETPIVIVTDGYHQMRAGLYAEQLDFTFYSAPSPTPWGLFPSYWVREWPGILRLWILGY